MLNSYTYLETLTSFRKYTNNGVLLEYTSKEHTLVARKQVRSKMEYSRRNSCISKILERRAREGGNILRIFIAVTVCDNLLFIILEVCLTYSFFALDKHFMIY